MRSRSAPGGAVEAPEQVASQHQLQALQFKDTLTWTAGKPIPVAELLRRLEALSKELRDIPQEEVDRDSLLPSARDLANKNLLGHKDKGVRAWTACCLVDILRLCAPDAPYTPAQLKEVFILFVKTVIPALSDAANPYTKQYLYVLQSLVQTKSAILLTDVPDPSDLLFDLFTTCFDILSGASEDLSRNVEHNLTGMLIIMVEEAVELSSEIVEIILSQFMRVDAMTAMGMTGRSKSIQGMDVQLPAAYNMARNICNSCSSRMIGYVGQYFSGIVVDASVQSDSAVKRRARGKASSEPVDSEDETTHGLNEDDFKELRKAHRLLRELWRASPDVLANVVPQLDVELSTENTDLRLLATEAVGDMTSGIGAAGPPQIASPDPASYPPLTVTSLDSEPVYQNSLMKPSSTKPFSQAYPSTYQSFLSRRKDKAASIRSAWTDSIGWILATRAGGTGLSSEEEYRLTKYLSQMLVDSDETVRLAAVKAISNFPFKDIVTRLGILGGLGDSGSLLCNLTDRVKDPKHAVRSEAMKLLGTLWGLSSGAMAENEENLASLLGPVPSKILEARYINFPAVNALLDHVMFESLWPLTYPLLKGKGKRQANGSQARHLTSEGEHHEVSIEEADKLRAIRILLLVKDLEPRAKKVLFAMLSRPMRFVKFVGAFLDRAEEFNGGVTDKKDSSSKQVLAKIIDSLTREFPDPARAAEDMWSFVKSHDRRTYQLLRFCIDPNSDYRKIFKSMREIQKRLEVKTPGKTSTIWETLVLFIYRISNFVYNKSHVPAIMEISQNDEMGLGSVAHEILNEIANNCPDVFKTHVQELCQRLESQAPKSVQITEEGAVNSLKACAGFAKTHPEEIPKERKFYQSMMHYALRSSTPKAAKYAVKIILTTAEKKEMYAKDLARQCTKSFTYGSENFITKLVTLSQVLLFASEAVEDDMNTIVDIAIEQVLNQFRTQESEDDPEWTDTPDEECEAKMWALRILVNHLRSFESEESARDLVLRVFRLLNGLVENNGELSKKKTSPKSHQSHLLLTAALSFLKLCRNKSFDKALSPLHFNALATVAQDNSLDVRLRFIDKLKKYIGQGSLPARFAAIPFLLATDQNVKLYDETATWIRGRTKAMENTRDSQGAPGITFACLLSILAHHPHLTDFKEDLPEFVQYVLFFLKTVASEDNLSSIFASAQRIKTVKDGIDPKSTNLYYLSDLAQAVIRHYESFHSWTMQDPEQKVQLPRGCIFVRFADHENGHEIAKKQFVPDKLADELERLVKEGMRAKKRKSEDVLEGSTKRRTTKSSAVIGHKSKSLPLHQSPKPKRTPKPKRVRTSSEVPSSEIRRSGRSGAQKNYAETGDSSDDAEMEGVDENDQESVAS